jgi:hypothetical protein
VSITSATSGATICYTTNGSTPAATTPGTCSTGTTLANGGTVTVSTSETLRAIATQSGFANSAVASANYTIGAADFSLSASPTSLTISRGSSGSSTVTVTAINGFSSVVSLTLQGLPNKTNYSFTPSSVTGSGSSTLKITVNKPASPGNYALMITGSGGGVTHTTTLTLTIN